MSANPKCATCGKIVYPTEIIRACNNTYHKMCLKCTSCGITLNLKTVISHNSTPYCRTHKPDISHHQVASVSDRNAMNAPKGANKVQGVAKNDSMNFQGGRGAPAARGGAAPRGAPRGGASWGASNVKVGGGGNKCPKCDKTVYQNEAIRACGSEWHKTCLKCSECSLTLNLKTLNSFENQPYCKVHVPTVKHTQVMSVEMQTAVKAPKAARAAKGIDKTARSTFAPGQMHSMGSDIVNRGSGDVQSQHAPAQRFIAPEPAPHISYEQRESGLTGAADGYSGGDAAYDQGGYDAAAYDQGSYAEESYDQGGYAEESYDQGGYDEAEEYPAEQYYEEEYPAEEYPAEEYPAEEYPAEEYPAEEYYEEEYYEEEYYEEEGYY